MITPEITGDIFESLLLNSLNFEKNSNHKKLTGSYYTPPHIVQYMIKISIEYYLREKTDIKTETIKNFLDDQNFILSIEEKKIIRHYILLIRILDPAVGSGAYPLGILEYLFKILKRCEYEGFIYSDFQLKKHILSKCIYGIDIQAAAIDICILRLYSDLIFSSQNSEDIYPNIKNNYAVENSLFSLGNLPKKYDLVIGNPPYIRHEKIKHLKLRLKKEYKIYNGLADIYTYFFELGVNILDDGGHLCYITSNKWMRASYGGNLRYFLKDKTQIKIIIDFKGEQIFKSATVDTNILLCRKH